MLREFKKDRSINNHLFCRKALSSSHETLVKAGFCCFAVCAWAGVVDPETSSRDGGGREGGASAKRAPGAFARWPVRSRWPLSVRACACVYVAAAGAAADCACAARGGAAGCRPPRLQVLLRVGLPRVGVT